MNAFGALQAVARSLSLEDTLEFWAQGIDPCWSLTEARARVVAITAETADVKTFVLEPNQLWRPGRAGQFVALGVEIDGVRVERCYSIASAPHSSRLSITVKHVPGGRVSGWLHAHLRVGDVVTLSPARGEFGLGTTSGPLLLLSGGSGITPVMAILRDLVRRGALPDVVFVHAARSAADVIFGHELRALAASTPGLRLVLTLDTERGGPLSSATLESLVPDWYARMTLLCGPARMMDALRPLWASRGLESKLRAERFTLAARQPLPGEVRGPVKLTLLQSRREVRISPEGTLLEGLEATGQRPASGCRMGICNTCRCHKRSGTIENVLTGELSSEPDEEIRLCVSRARGDLDLFL